MEVVVVVVDDVVEVDEAPPPVAVAVTRTIRPPRNFGWSWRDASSSGASPTPKQTQQPRRRRYNVCDVVTGKRIAEKQYVVANQHPPNVTAVRTIYVDSRVETTDAAATVEPASVIMAAGVLFFSQRPGNDGGDTLYLLGREQFYPHWPDSDKWADFGGGVDVADEDVESTAAREAWEESMGTIHTYEVLLSRLRNGEASAVYDIQASDNAGCYRIYLLRVPYYDYNMMLSRFRSYLRRHKLQILDAEKTSLEWVDSHHLVHIAEMDATPLRPNFAKSIIEINRRIDLHSLDRSIRSERVADADADDGDDNVADEAASEKSTPEADQLGCDV